MTWFNVHMYVNHSGYCLEYRLEESRGSGNQFGGHQANQAKDEGDLAKDDDCRRRKKRDGIKLCLQIKLTMIADRLDGRGEEKLQIFGLSR